MKHEKAVSWRYSFFAFGIFSFLVLSCGTEFQPDKSVNNDDPASPESDGSDLDYGLFVNGQLEDDLHTVSVRGSVSPAHAGDVKIRIKQSSTGITKTATPYSTGVFYAGFALSAPSGSESFEVTVVDGSGLPRTAVNLLEVDLTGDWDGEFSITSKSDSCESVPIVSSLDTPITVTQEASQFVVYLGGYLNVYPITVTVDEDGNLTGSGTIGIPANLASYVGCYENVAYSFDGRLNNGSDPPSFEVDFSATLSGAAPGCADPSPDSCILQGMVTGEKE